MSEIGIDISVFFATVHDGWLNVEQGLWGSITALRIFMESVASYASVGMCVCVCASVCVGPAG